MSRGHGLGSPRLGFRAVGAASVAAAQSTSLLQLAHQGTVVKKHVNCLRGSKTKLTGSVVRLKNIAAPSVCLSLGPKVTRVFHCEQRRRRKEKGAPTNKVGHTFMHLNNHD